MTTKVQDLTEKIYNEGVSKANADAKEIIADAKKGADIIIQDAKKQKEEWLAQAKKEMAELKNNTEAELQLAAQQFISHIKQQITNVITTAQVKNAVEEAFNDNNFIKDIILTLVKNWNTQNREQPDIKLLLPEKDRENLTAFFESKAFAALNNGIEIQWDEKVKTGFNIGPKDGSYILRFSAVDFENYFKKYFKERTRTLLFEKIKDND